MFILRQHITGLLLLVSLHSTAQPTVATSQVIAGQQVFGDLKKTSLFYYVPYGYNLVSDSKGKPEFSLVQMRYTGTRAGGDAGAVKFNNRLQFKIAISNHDLQKINTVKAELKKKFPAAELRPLPVKKFSSVLVFAGTGTVSDSEDSLRMVAAGYEASDESASVNNSYWTERIISVGLNNNDAQLVESALRNKQSIMSFSYAIYTVFSEKNAVVAVIKGDDTFSKQLKNYFDSQINNTKDSGRITLVKTDALNLAIDPEIWPSSLQKIDINEKLPAKYPLFDVYCYDFNNALRYDLFAKKIEIKATSVNGADITTAYTFKDNQPDLYSKSIRFAYAIRFDRPFFYRVTEITTDGEATTTAWMEKKEWSEILDITSPPDKVRVKPTEEN